MKKIANKHNLPFYKVEDVVESIFGLVHHIFIDEVDSTREHFPTIGVPFFGKFYSDPALKRRIRLHEDLRNKG